MVILSAVFVFQVVEEPRLEQHELFEAEDIDGEIGVDGFYVFIGWDYGIELGNCLEVPIDAFEICVGAG